MAPPEEEYERPVPVGIRAASLNEPGSNEYTSEKGWSQASQERLAVSELKPSRKRERTYPPQTPLG